MRLVTSVASLLRQALHSNGDVLVTYRDRIAMLLSTLAVLMLLPFTVVDLIAGHLALAAAIASVQIILGINARALHRGAPVRVPFEALVVAMVLAIAVAINVLGQKAVFWAYPGVFILYFLVARRLALVMSLILVGASVVLVSRHVTPDVAARVGATLLLTLLMINVVLNVIGELQQALVKQAITDPLTGAFNRRHFDSRVRGLADVEDRSGAAPRNALLAIDIDHFKSINDRFGHDVGDEVLRRTVALVQQRKRHDDQLFRTGGEEFVLLLPGATRNAALRVAEELRQRVAEATLLTGETVTVSIGVSMQLPGQGSSAWIKRGDQALYEAKRSGRNRVVLAGEAG